MRFKASSRERNDAKKYCRIITGLRYHNFYRNSEVKEQYSERQLQEMPKHNRGGAILYF
jgi:hypothetical protein